MCPLFGGFTVHTLQYFSWKHTRHVPLALFPGTHEVAGSRHEDLFTFISPATEKLKKQDKFQPRDKSYLYNITESEAGPLKDSSAASVAIQKQLLFRYVS